MKHEGREVASSRLSPGGTSRCLQLGHLSVTPQASRPSARRPRAPPRGQGWRGTDGRLPSPGTPPPLPGLAGPRHRPDLHAGRALAA